MTESKRFPHSISIAGEINISDFENGLFKNKNLHLLTPIEFIAKTLLLNSNYS